MIIFELKNTLPTLTGHTCLILAPPLFTQYQTSRLYTGPIVVYPISASIFPPSDILPNTHAIMLDALLDIIFPLVSNPVTTFPFGTTHDCVPKYSFIKVA